MYACNSDRTIYFTVLILYSRRMYIAKVPNRNSPPAILIRESYPYSSHRERRIQSKLNSESGEAERSSKR